MRWPRCYYALMLLLLPRPRCVRAILLHICGLASTIARDSTWQRHIGKSWLLSNIESENVAANPKHARNHCESNTKSTHLSPLGLIFLKILRYVDIFLNEMRVLFPDGLGAYSLRLKHLGRRQGLGKVHICHRHHDAGTSKRGDAEAVSEEPAIQDEQDARLHGTCKALDDSVTVLVNSAHDDAHERLREQDGDDKGIVVALEKGSRRGAARRIEPGEVQKHIDDESLRVEAHVLHVHRALAFLQHPGVVHGGEGRNENRENKPGQSQRLDVVTVSA
mmetsp:Transcript_21325/g.42775  ORF Transcript_21325/g.42775 Transcript_21325/m.42775 type:complete len:277 (+) Transcript_21325:344-1174(+)